jgi:hypothetical protein
MLEILLCSLTHILTNFVKSKLKASTYDETEVILHEYVLCWIDVQFHTFLILALNGDY